ncbi:MAG: glycosyltransferase family 2 protein [Verrucomicrobiia bacterium]
MFVSAVIVTCNRLELLKENLAAVRGQTRVPDEIIVINNGSTDGTAEWLKIQTGLTVIQQENLGSSGGQYAGIKAAFEHGHEWFWCMDDDTIPAPDALEMLLASAHASELETGFLCSAVFWTDGTLHRMNMTASTMPASTNDPRWLQGVQTDESSFVSVLFRREAVQACGLPLREMFIWCDDKEFTLRIAKKFKGWIIPTSRVVHKTKRNVGVGLEEIGDASVDKFRYGLRNMVFMQMRRVTTHHFYNVRGAIRLILRTTPALFRQCSFKNALILFRSMIAGLFFNPPVRFP